MADTDRDGLGDSLESTLRTNPTSNLTPVWLVVGAVLVVLVVAIGATRLRRGWRERFGGTTDGLDSDDGAEATTNHETGNATEPAVERTPEPLTDEDRVLTLLREHGGRMKQSRIVAETEWSKAKVSRLLSAMTDDGEIDKLSIGRENIISLEGHRPEAARPPHEENASD